MLRARLTPALVALLLISVTSCSADTTTVSSSPPAPPSTRPTPAVPVAPALPPGVPEIKFETIDMTIKGKPFKIEIADTVEKEARGLMYRSSMPADHGMLFVFKEPALLSFWMKNTLIPLDIIYLDSTAKVIEIHKRVPHDETGRGPATPTQFVIELNAGISDAIGLKRGDTVTLPGKYLNLAPPTTEK